MIQHHLLFRLAAWGLILVHVFEAPAWTFRVDNAADQAVYPSYDIPFLSVTASNLLTLMLILILSLGCALENTFEVSKTRRRLLAIIFLTLALKCIESSVSLVLAAFNHAPISLSPCEAVMIVLVERQYHRNIPYLVRIIPPFAVLILVLSAVVCAYTAFGYLIFDPGSSEMVQFFPTYGDAIWNMLMVLDGSNWPTPMIPSYIQNRLYCLYFVIYLVVVNWGFLNLTLGFIFASFQLERERIAALRREVKNNNLNRAFIVLDSESKGYLVAEELDPVIEYLYKNFESNVIEPPSADERRDLIAELNTSGDGKVKPAEFLHLLETCFGGALNKLRSRTRIGRYFSLASLSSVMRGVSFSTSSRAPSIDSILHPRRSTPASSGREVLSPLQENIDAVDVAGNIGGVDEEDSAERDGANNLTATITERTSSSARPLPPPWEVRKPQSLLARTNTMDTESAAVYTHRRGWSSEGEANKGKKLTIKEVMQMPRPTTFPEFLWFVVRIIDSVFYDMAMDSLVVFVGIVLFFTSSLTVYDFLVAICLLESISKLCVKGFYRFRRSYRNSATGVLTILMLICATLMHRHGGGTDYRFAVQSIVLLRILFYPLNLLVLERFKSSRRKYIRALHFAVSGAGDFLFLMLVLFMCIYAAASLGVQLFGGIICKSGNNYTLIQNSLYGQSGYWPLNFNDMLSAMATMFVLLHVNNMHVTASGFTAVLGDPALIFFTGWYVVGVLLMLNVVIAFFLAQLLQYITGSSNSTDDVSRDVVSEAANAKSSQEHVTVVPLESVPECKVHVSPTKPLADVVALAQSPSSLSPTSKSPPHKLFRQSIFANKGRREQLVHTVEDSYETYRQSIISPANEAMRPSEAHFPLGVSNVVDNLVDAIPVDRLQPTDNSLSFKSIMEDLEKPYDRTTRREMHSSMKDWVTGQTELASHEAAAVLIQYARDGGHYTLFSTVTALRCYRLRQKAAMWLRTCCWLLMLLKVFERPHWTFFNAGWQSNSYPKSGIYYLSPTAALGIKLPLLCCLFMGLMLEFGYKENGRLVISYLSPMVITRYLLMAACFGQCVLLAYIGISGKCQDFVVLTSFGTSIYLFWFDKRTLVKFKLVVQIIPALSVVLLGFLFLVLFFASMGPFIFNECSNCDDDDFNRSQFETLPDSVWSVFVAITSSSYPGQVIPIYRRSRLFFLYFFAFISLGAYGVLNLCLVVVLYQYNRKVENHADDVSISQELLMLRAFQILDTKHAGFLTYKQVSAVLTELYQHYNDFRKAGVPSVSKQALLVKILDTDGDGKISPEDFACLIDVTRIKLKMDDDETFIQQYMPALAASRFFIGLSYIVKSHTYMTIMDITLFSLMLADLSLTPDIYSLHTARKYFSIKVVVLACLAFNFAATYIVNGHRNFVKYLRNRVDLFIFISFLFVVIGLAATKENAPLYAGIAVYGQLTEILRVLLFPRLFRPLLPEGSYRQLNVAVRKIIRSVYTLMVVFVCTFYAMCNIGVIVFGGKVSTSPTSPHYEALNASQYGINNFWTLNFNDMPSAFVTLFCCLHVSDFDVITSGFVAVTSTWARVYFTAWYVIGVLLLLNIVKSYFLSGSLMAAVRVSMNYKLPKWKPSMLYSCCCGNASHCEDLAGTGLSMTGDVLTTSESLALPAVATSSEQSIARSTSQIALNQLHNTNLTADDEQFILYCTADDNREAVEFAEAESSSLSGRCRGLSSVSNNELNSSLLDQGKLFSSWRITPTLCPYLLYLLRDRIV